MKDLRELEVRQTPPLTNTPQKEQPIMVSYFGTNQKTGVCGISNVIPNKDANIVGILECIKNGYWRKQIENLRGQDDHIAFKRDKEALPYFTPSGTFSYHSNDKIKKHSGLICLDFDDVAYVEDVAQLASECPYTFASFISPSGEGLKVLCKIQPEKHEQAFYGLCGYYKRHLFLEPDYKVKPVFMACFVSFDAHLYHNPIATTWTI